MKRTLFPSTLLWASLAVALLLSAPLGAQEADAPPVAVTYTLDVTQPKSGEAKVEMLVENNRDEEVTLGLPVWAPGSYRVVSYHLGVRDLEAEVAGKKVEVTATDHKSLWKLKTGGAPKFKVRYTLKPSEVMPIRENLTEEHYDLQGPSAWLFVKDRLNGPHRVSFKLPTGWKVGTGLKKSKTGSAYEERDYDTFIDCPIELGKFALQEFKEGGVDYELVIHAAGEVAVAKLVEVCKKIVAEQMRLFGGAPFDRYVFIYHFRNQGFGAGLEHLNSTHIVFPMSRLKDDPASVASITSHEFFHLWNVKRIRPKELGPFDYTQPVRSKALWLSEGVTSYFGDLTLVRAGIWTRERYLEHLAAEIGELQGNPARKTQSAEDSSWTVWDRGRNDRTPFVDYYNKGELLGWLIDLKIRHATGGKKSFDDVMRHLYRVGVVEPSKAGQGPIGVGFEEKGILAAVNEVSGQDFTKFFKDYISGTEELPYAEVAPLAGLSVSRQKGLGVVLRDMKVQSDPPAESEAEKAGLKKGDEIIRINETPVGKGVQLSKVLDPFKFGEIVTLLVTREKEKGPIKVNLPVVEGRFDLAVSAEPTPEQASLLKGWLSPSK